MTTGASNAFAVRIENGAAPADIEATRQKKAAAGEACSSGPAAWFGVWGGVLQGVKGERPLCACGDVW